MILLLDNYDSFTYNLFHQISGFYEPVKVVRNDTVTVEEVRRWAPRAIVISPGPGVPARAGITVPLIRELAPSVPILGVCLGHQAIGEAFGGRVVRAKEPVHGKDSLIFHRRLNLFRDLPLPFSAGRYHSLVVERATLPGDLAVEAETEDEVIMALRHLSYPCFGVQFHPESILTSEGRKIMRNFLSIAGIPAAKEALC